MKYVPGLLAGQLSGSAGSTTAGHNRYGSYFRPRNVPVNPNTASQTLVRDRLKALAQRWRTLTASQRTGWNNLADTIPLLDAQGVTYFQSGQQLYVGLNINRAISSQATLDDAPVLDAIPSMSALALELNLAASAKVNITFTAVDGGAGNFFVLQATAPVSAGVAFFPRSAYRQIKVIPGNQASPHDVTAAYQTVFGSTWLTQTGARIGLRVVPLSETAFAGSEIRASALVQ